MKPKYMQILLLLVRFLRKAVQGEKFNLVFSKESFVAYPSVRLISYSIFFAFERHLSININKKGTSWAPLFPSITWAAVHKS